MLVSLRFQTVESATEEFTAQAQHAMSVLATRPGFQSADLGRSIDDPGLYVLTMQWADVGSYRRALGSYDVKLQAVEFLSQAIDEPSAYEVLVAVDENGQLRTDTSDRAVDADSVGLGRAAEPGSFGGYGSPSEPK